MTLSTSQESNRNEKDNQNENEKGKMKKSIETTITSSSVQQSDWDEKEKEKENENENENEKDKEIENENENVEIEACKVLERRESSVRLECLPANDTSDPKTTDGMPLISTERLDPTPAPVSDIPPSIGISSEDQKPNLSNNSSEESIVSNPKIQLVENLAIESYSNPRETDTSSKSESPRLRKNSRDSRISRDSTESKYLTDAFGEEVDSISKCSDSLEQDALASNTLQFTTNISGAVVEKAKAISRLSDRAKKKSWYNVLYPTTYKSRAEDFKKLFKDVPNDERLIVEYSCALQREILVQGRLYVSQNYVCFHANIFRWETYLCLKWKDVTSITKEKTALVIPNAISICTANEKYFFATFTSRDKSFLMLFRVWQNTLMNKPMAPQEMWQYVHNSYGEELGLTSDDEDYIDPRIATNETEGETEFSSALEDTISLNSNSFNTDLNNPISSVKTKKSYFFTTTKSSSASANTTSGSDNKTSDNNSGGDQRRSTMKPNDKDFTLITAEMEEKNDVENDSPEVLVVETKVNRSNNASTPAKELKAITTDGKRKVSKNTRQRDETLAKNTENVPTDMSNSSDSADDQIPFVVTAECTSTHEGRQLVHTILPINVDTLFNLLFSKSKFLVDFHTMRKSTEAVFPDWTINENGQKTRTVNVTVQLAASVGPKTSKVTEQQLMRDCSKPGELYSIDVNSFNTGIPYADSFSVLLHYCLVRTLDDHTMLSVHAQIKYKKSIWGMVKGFIEKNCWAGLEDFFTSLLHSLQSEACIPPAKGKGRRPRRGATAAQARAVDDGAAVSTLAQAKAETTEHLSATHPHYMQHLPLKSQAMAGDSPTSRYKWLSLFVIVLLLFLIAVNVVLLVKLWRLESRIEDDLSSRARMPNLSTLKKLPNSHKEWMGLLRQQEILHEEELRKWQNVLQTAIELLKKTEKTLAELMFH